MPELQDIVMWLMTSFGADAAHWAEMAVASFWRQGETLAAAEWDAVRAAVVSLQDAPLVEALRAPVH